MGHLGVVGIGNVLMGDDALGPYVVKMLDAHFELAPGVEVLELGTPGPDLALHLQGFDQIVVIDTIDAAGKPGEVRILDKTQILSRGPAFAASPHEPGLREALFTLELHGKGPTEVRLVGAIPASVEMHVGLSQAVQAAVPTALVETLRLLEELGACPRARAVSRPPGLWWELPAAS